MPAPFNAKTRAFRNRPPFLHETQVGTQSRSFLLQSLGFAQFPEVASPRPHACRTEAVRPPEKQCVGADDASALEAIDPMRKPHDLEQPLPYEPVGAAKVAGIFGELFYVRPDPTRRIEVRLCQISVTR